MRSAEKVVVVHRGARDGYQVALALAEAGRLERLVTDLYWPGGPARHLLPAGLRRLLQQRQALGLPAGCVRQLAGSGLLSFGLEKARRVPFAWRRQAVRWTDVRLGAYAGRLATERGAALLAYSYYAGSAFAAYRGPAPELLFQLHPHPASMRRILQAELTDHPECAGSLETEWELALPEHDFRSLVAETHAAKHWLVASSFTKETLVENGIDGGRVHVIPYGVDLERFRPDERSRSTAGPLRLLFVGTINQRKGIQYLVDAVGRFREDEVELTVCGRVVDDLRVLGSLGRRVRVRPNVSDAELRAAYQAAELFVFPSVAEGFGHVLLEALASGLPILTTTRTAGPDLIVEGEAGFVVPARHADALAERIGWAVGNRARLHSMRRAARATAEQFTWARFRRQLVTTVDACLGDGAINAAAPQQAEPLHV